LSITTINLCIDSFDFDQFGELRSGFHWAAAGDSRWFACWVRTYTYSYW